MTSRGSVPPASVRVLARVLEDGVRAIAAEEHRPADEVRDELLQAIRDTDAMDPATNRPPLQIAPDENWGAAPSQASLSDKDWSLPLLPEKKVPPEPSAAVRAGMAAGVGRGELERLFSSPRVAMPAAPAHSLNPLANRTRVKRFEKDQEASKRAAALDEALNQVAHAASPEEMRQETLRFVLNHGGCQAESTQEVRDAIGRAKPEDYESLLQTVTSPFFDQLSDFDTALVDLIPSILDSGWNASSFAKASQELRSNLSTVTCYYGESRAGEQAKAVTEALNRLLDSIVALGKQAARSCLAARLSRTRVELPRSRSECRSVGADPDT